VQLRRNIAHTPRGLVSISAFNAMRKCNEGDNEYNKSKTKPNLNPNPKGNDLNTLKVGRKCALTERAAKYIPKERNTNDTI